MKAARQQQIVELLNQHHTLTTEALSHLLQVSIETIRRDLSELQKQGRLQRSHGQARVLQRNNHNGEKPFHSRVKAIMPINLISRVRRWRGLMKG